VKVPADVQAAVESSLSTSLDRRVKLVGARAVGGGCISPTARVEFETAPTGFLKWSAPGQVAANFFLEEARSLQALEAAGAVRVPSVTAVNERWLLLEWLEPGRANARMWPDLGIALAQSHRNRGDAFGWVADNFIGSLPQPNGWLESWPEFWRARRLVPQLERAYAAGHFDARDRRRFDVLLARLDDALATAARDGPSLLHGDLWNGNVHVMEGGGAALVDPSSYYGHREVDLAMAELFGGLGRVFFDAYREEWPIAAGYHELRRPIYQLYYLLVHVNLFGAAYTSGSRAAADSALAALGIP
jgi:fructosamine-3-kinase